MRMEMVSRAEFEEMYPPEYPNDESLDRARAIAVQSCDRAAWVAMGGSLAAWQRVKMKRECKR